MENVKPIEDISRLNDAFQNFMLASQSLEHMYQQLKDRVVYLTGELEQKNKLLEKALYDTEEAEDYLKGILESLSESIIVLDPSGNVTMFNRAAQILTGLSAADVIGRPFNALGIKFEDEGADTFMKTRKKQHNVFMSRSNVSDSRGFVRGQVIMIQDMTRMKELESHQERNKRLIAMGEMAAQIVHEIRSPLCSIELYASMLENELGSAPQTNFAKGIYTGIRSLNNILTNMLFFAKPQKPVFHSSTLNPIVSETIFMLMPLVEARGIQFTRSECSDAQVLGDSELLKQVLMNVIINAIQAAGEGGEIFINECINDNKAAVVEVRDNGEGIDSENLERIFDPFFSTKEKGTGLGLAIASKIMLAHGGIIRAKSKKGKGSTFQIVLPLKL
ncbi:MAG: ATP-binding protein [Candidatus Magnetominusculus sp. LBB02]|nr:ATP-binding protein [Candidatus Magnetominusculus sp. LBB02]